MALSLHSNSIVIFAEGLERGEVLATSLRAHGYDAHHLPEPLENPAQVAAVVIVCDGLPDPLAVVGEWVQRAAGDCALVATGLPVELIGQASALGVDEVLVAGAPIEEVAQRVGNALRLASGRSQLSRGELEALLEIAEAATSHLELEELLRVVVARIATVVAVDRCSAILLDGDEHAIVMASHDVPGLRRLRIDMKRYPELREAVQSRVPVVIDDVLTHPLMEEVRPLVSSLPVSSLVVAPLVAQGDAYGALYLRLARDRSFGVHEQVFVRAAASAVANSVRNARLHTSVREKRDELEAAYHERYEELVRLNDQLREANRIKDELLAVCSHDVRAPLNVLLGHVRLLLMGDLAGPQRRSTEAIERQGLRVLQLVQQILERGRGLEGAVEFSFERVDLSAMARQVAEDLGILAAERRISIDAEGGELVAEVDSSAIRQVLENLVTNAMAHSPEDSSVEIEIALDPTSGEKARVEIRDRGPGIPESELALIFERYRKGGASKGLGLGLAICREVVEAHHGQLWAQRREGGGTTFVFTVPLIRGVEEAGDQPRVLLVEEKDSLSCLLEGSLEKGTVLSFVTGPGEGIARARNLLPDLILVDAHMAHGGLAFAHALKAEPGLGEIPLVLVGKGAGNDLADGIRFLQLPLDANELQTLIAELAPGR